jgi:hypothetical protein
MEEIASQIRSLRREHEVALLQYDFAQASLIHQQIERLQKGLVKGQKAPDLNSEHERGMTVARASELDQVLAKMRIEVRTRFLQRRQEIEERYTQEYEGLCLQHAIAVERCAARPIPVADACFQESVRLGRMHDYRAAAGVHAQAQKVQAAVHKERLAEIDAAFARSEQALRAKEARDLALLDDREERALLEIERQYSDARGILANRLKAQTYKATRGQPRTPDRYPMSLSPVRRSPSTPRRPATPSSVRANLNL